MKKLYSLIAFLLFSAISMAQVQVTIQSAGVYKISYGASNDYSVYDPGFGTPSFYAHVWVQANQNSANMLFEDAWSNSNVVLSWDSSANAYIGYVNLNTKLFTNSSNTMPPSTTVTQLNFVFKDLQNGATRQSGNLSSTLSTTTLGSLAVSNVKSGKEKSFVSGGNLYTSEKGNIQISVYDFGGKFIKTLKVKSGGNPIALDILQKGNYILQLSGGNSKEIIKFRY